MATFEDVTWLDAERRPPSARPVRPTVREMLRAMWTRRLLAEMDDRMLADIGISRGDALAEASRAPWDVLPGM